ncbi:unnamed protein product [Lathyrus sativus]|nr:unnamed protein product [Lathyrus sativus]
MKGKMGLVVITRRDLMYKSNLSNKSNNISKRRMIPKRGQVKMGIVVGLFHNVSSIFSSRCVQLS